MGLPRSTYYDMPSIQVGPQRDRRPDPRDLRRVCDLRLSASGRSTSPPSSRRKQQEDPSLDTPIRLATATTQAFCHDHGKCAQSARVSQFSSRSDAGWTQSDLGRRHHPHRRCHRLRVRRPDGRRLVTTCRGLRHRAIHRHAAHRGGSRFPSLRPTTSAITIPNSTRSIVAPAPSTCYAPTAPRRSTAHFAIRQGIGVGTHARRKNQQHGKPSRWCGTRQLQHDISATALVA